MMIETTGTVEIDTTCYPTSDGLPMAETGIHVNVMVLLITLLRLRYLHMSDMYIIDNIFLYYEKGNPSAVRSPDVMVIKGVLSTPERDSFKTWVENAVPTVVFEITSQKTREEDLGPKKDLYEQLGVREYFLFDPRHEYLPSPLIGFVLHRVANGNGNGNGNGHGEVNLEAEVRNEYQELPAAKDGSLISRELGLRLVPEGQSLKLIDLNTGEALMAPQEMFQANAELIHQLEQSAKRAEDERRRAEQATKLAAEEKRRAELAESARTHALQQAKDAVRRADEEARLRTEEGRRADEEARRADEEARLRKEEAHRADNAVSRAEELQRELDRLRGLSPPQSDGSPP